LVHDVAKEMPIMHTRPKKIEYFMSEFLIVYSEYYF